ncbi:hypothetical protein EDD99_2632 [Streptomyces sp. 846.5]|nr:hypothetical protein [Streptomyces sp. 846.5]TDU04177.1 hypothetical protein EDD99_2632 [Streptomyces sp. 846.5]
MTTVDAAHWQRALNRLNTPNARRLLVVQCSLDWLTPALHDLRERTDQALVDACTRNRRLRVDRLVLHNLPVGGPVAAGALADLTAAHRAWMYRLTVTKLLLPDPERLHVHRLIVPGSDARADVQDLLDLEHDGIWGHPAQVQPVLRLLAAGRRTTPLTGYDVDLDGPFGDADPSVYF